MTLAVQHNIERGPIETRIQERWKAARKRIEEAKKSLVNSKSYRPIFEIDAEIEATKTKLHNLRIERIGAKSGEPSIAEIQDVACVFYNITRTNLLSKRREMDIVRPRQIATFLAKELTTMSLPEIGREFGGQDHTTILHSIRKIEMLTWIDVELVNDLEKISKIILLQSGSSS